MCYFLLKIIRKLFFLFTLSVFDEFLRKNSSRDTKSKRVFFFNVIAAVKVVSNTSSSNPVVFGIRNSCTLIGKGINYFYLFLIGKYSFLADRPDGTLINFSYTWRYGVVVFHKVNVLFIWMEVRWKKGPLVTSHPILTSNPQYV